MSPSINEPNGGSRGGARGDRHPPPPPLSQGLDDRAPPVSQGLDPALNVYHV